jgi:hypothetical protein
LLAALSLFAVACGGDGDADTASPSSPDASASTGATGNTGATLQSTGATAGTGAAAPATGSTGGTLQSTGPTGSGPGNLNDLSGLQSFRWDVTVGGAGALLSAAGFPSLDGSDASEFTAHGAYIAPDQGQVEVAVAGFEYKQTIKGDQQWTSIAGVTTGPVAATDSADALIYVTAFFDPATLAEPTDLDCGDSEDVNGVEAIRCETTKADEIAAGLAGEDAEIDEASFVIWVAEEGDFIVKYDFKASGSAAGQDFEWSLVANITDINNVGSIEP